jgi:hypothetical protein
MELYALYLRQLAMTYRTQATDADDPEDQAEYLALATVCEDVAASVEDRSSGG